MEMVTFEPWFMHTIQAINQKMPDVELRDLFAMAALNGVLSDCEFHSYEQQAEIAYHFADAMLRVRRKK